MSAAPKLALAAPAEQGTANEREPAFTEWCEAGRAVLDAPDVLALVRDWARSVGYAGDTRPVELLALAMATRVMRRPISLFYGGASAGGKNFAVSTGLMLFPESAYYRVAGMSPKGIMYDKTPLQHRYLVVEELAALNTKDSQGTSLLRSLVWTDDNGDDAQKLRYVSVGESRTSQVLEKEGPIGLILTATSGAEPELASRMHFCTIDDSQEQTRKILRAQAARAAGETSASGDTALRATFHMAQRWLQRYGARDAVIPFAMSLQESLDTAKHELRLRRDFSQLVQLIKGSALLHQQTRERDEQGRVIATLADYRNVYAVVDASWRATTGASETMRETVAAVNAAAKFSDAAYSTATATLTDVAAHLGIVKSAAHYRLKQATEAGYLVNEEVRRGRPGAFRIGEPLPEGNAGLPAPDELERLYATA